MKHKPATKPARTIQDDTPGLLWIKSDFGDTPIVPVNVTFLRPLRVIEVNHVAACALPEDNTGVTEACGWLGCTKELPGATEVMFVNTMGQESSIVAKEPVEKVARKLHLALRHLHY